MKSFWVTIGLVCALAAQSFGQTTPAVSAAPPLPAQTTATPDAYRLQPDDALRILVYNEAQANGDVQVDANGYISAPFVGLLLVAGKTTAEVEAMLVDAYRTKWRIRDPRVSVLITKFRSLKATVGGYVSHPGQYEFRRGDTIVTLLNLGGGAVPDQADLKRATLRRANSNELIPIDLYSMLIKGDTSQNYKLEDGDELTVPEETDMRVSVQGAVQAPGIYPYKEPMTLADAISVAKGEIPNKTMFSKVQIIRQLKGRPGQFLHIQANYIKFLDGDSSQNIALLPGDLIIVPNTKTPDFAQLSSIISSLYFTSQLAGTGLFGIKL